MTSNRTDDSGAPDYFSMSDEELTAELARMEAELPGVTRAHDYMSGAMTEEEAREFEQLMESSPALTEHVAMLRFIRDAMRRAAKERTRSTPPPKTVTPVAVAQPRLPLVYRSTFWIISLSLALALGVLGGWIASSMWSDKGTFRAKRGRESVRMPEMMIPRVFMNRVTVARLHQDSRLAYEYEGILPGFPGLPAQHAVDLDGGGDFVTNMPGGRQLRVDTPFLTVRAHKARFRIRLDPPCTTFVSVTEGEVQMTPRYRGATATMRAGDVLRIACDQAVSRGTMGEGGEQRYVLDTAFFPKGTFSQ